MLISTLGFSLMNLCVKALGRIPPHEIIVFRVGVSFCITYYLMQNAGVKLWGRNIKWLLVRGAAGALALWLYFITLKNMPLATAVAIQYMSPLFGVMLAPIFIKEKMRPIQWLYFLVSFAGVVLLKGFDTSVSLFYLLIGLLSALLTGLSTNAIRKTSHTDHPLLVMLYLPIFALPTSAPFAVMQWVPPAGWEIVLLLLTGVFTQISQYYSTLAIQTDRLERVTYLNYLGLIYAVVFGFFIFSEPLTLGTFGALCLVAAGVMLNLGHNNRQIAKWRKHSAWQLRSHYRKRLNKNRFPPKRNPNK